MLSGRPAARRGVDVVRGLRFRGHITAFDGDVLRGRPVTERVGQPEHLVATAIPAVPYPSAATTP
jgi:hypothetical protein